jgi:hypothetical protein
MVWSVYTPRPLIVDLNIGAIFFLTLGCTGRCSHCAALVVLELDCPRLITLCLQVSFEVFLFQISCLLLVLYWLIKSGYSFCKFEQLEIDEALDSLHKELFKRYLLWLTRLWNWNRDAGACCSGLHSSRDFGCPQLFEGSSLCFVWIVIICDERTNNICRK